MVKDILRPRLPRTSDSIMIYVSVSELEPDMVLAAPVRPPAADNHVLLNSGYCMEAETIAGLNRFGIKAVWIRHPGFDFLDEKLGDEIPRSRAKLYMSVKRTFNGIANKTSGAFDLIEYRTLIGNTIMALVANKNNAVWAERLMDGDNELFAHCSNVAYLSLVIGMRIKHYIFAQRKFVNYSDGTDLTNLGIGAMLHDLGKLGLDPQWHDTHFFDTRANTEDYRSHAERGYRAVRDRIEATASQVLLHHHQRFDGTGFPNRKARSQEETAKPMVGHDIHIFSRIVAVANAIDGLMSRCKKRQRPLIAALAAIQTPAFEGMFEPLVLDAALRLIPPFPLGARVELSDRRQAVVTDLNEAKPCQPQVGLLHTNLNGNGESYEELDLSGPDAPSIVRIGDQLVSPEAFYTLPERDICEPVAMCSRNP